MGPCEAHSPFGEAFVCGNKIFVNCIDLYKTCFLALPAGLNCSDDLMTPPKCVYLPIKCLTFVLVFNTGVLRHVRVRLFACTCNTKK